MSCILSSRISKFSLSAFSHNFQITYRVPPHSALITDNYKSNPVVAIYDWRSRPFLDHYRLKVPYVRKTLELIAFASVFILFLITEGSAYDSLYISLLTALTQIYFRQPTISTTSIFPKDSSSFGRLVSPSTSSPPYTKMDSLLTSTERSTCSIPSFAASSSFTSS